MKKRRAVCIIIALFGVMAIASCGGGDGGGGSSTAQQAINNSAAAFGNIIDSIIANPGACTPKAILECSCPNGGTVDLDDATFSLTFNSCKSDSLTYNGTVSTDATGSSITANMTQFGECSNVTGTITGADVDNCSGTLTGTCAGENITCTMSADCETCNI